MKKLLKAVLAGLMMIGNTNLALAEELPSENEEKVLDLQDLDPETLHVSKLGEIDQDLKPEAEAEPYRLSDIVRVSIELEDASTADAGYSTENIAENAEAVSYRSGLKAKQNALVEEINSMLGSPIEVKWNLTLLMNVISANVKYGDIAKIKKMSGVKDVFIENQYEINEDEINTANTSADMVGAVTTWADGYSGAGSRIAIIDTGIDTTHQSFNADAFDHSIAELRSEGAEIDLMTSADVDAVKSQLNGSSGTYRTTKIPFGYNYVDKSSDITHTNDTQGEHGSHVAGIAAANKYIKSGSNYNDAASTVKAVGMAPDAQLLVMKVFGANGGASDSDYMAAIEDAIVLGCDTANLSLGSSSPGTSFSGSYQDKMNNLIEHDLVATISAGNSASFADNIGQDLYIDDIYMHTGGTPGSMINSFTTASADNLASSYEPMMFNGSQPVYFTEGSGSATMSSIAGTYSYVYIDSIGNAADYEAVNKAVSLSGKVVIINRGELSFVEKGNNAVSYSPKALICANNKKGGISMGLDDFTGSFPYVSIGVSEAQKIKDISTVGTTGGYTYYTGTVVISSETVDRPAARMSSFSAWGVPGSLILKPEITAPGGLIYSVFGTNKTATGTAGGSDQYELMSGTSMAAPHMAGLSAVLAQYMDENKEKFSSVEGYTLRALNQSLLMSTATPMINDGEYVSILQQGSGLVDVHNAVSANSVILMDQSENTLTARTGAAKDGKVKAELGDNPTRTAPYTYSFTIYNLNDQDVNYDLRTDLFTQAHYEKDGLAYMSTETSAIEGWDVDYVWEGTAVEGHDANKDGSTTDADVNAILEYVARNAAGDAYEIDENAADLDKDGKVTTSDAYQLISWLKESHGSAADGVVPARGSRKVTVTITPDSARSLDASYPSGAYVEGFTYVKAVTETKDGAATDVEQSIPILGFYGNWTDPNMFDTTSYIDTVYGSTKEAYSGNADTNYMTLQYNGTLAKFTGNPYKAESEFPADRLAINSGSLIDAFTYNLIRSAATTGFAVSEVDKVNGNITNVLSSSVLGYNVTGQYYYTNQQTWQNTGSKSYSLQKTAASYGLKEGDQFRIGYYAIPEYYGFLENDDLTDNSAGCLSDEQFVDVLEKNMTGKGAYIGYDFTVDDTAPVIEEAVLSGNTLTIKASDNANLAYLAVRAIDGSALYAEATPGKAEYTLSFDASSAIANARGYVAVFAGDYAGNETAKAVQVNSNTSGVDPYNVSEITLTPSSLDLYKGATAYISASVTPITATDQTISWKSSNTSVATVDENGLVTAVGGGSARITATSNANSSVTATCSVNVVSVNKALNGIVWDESGDVYFSSFNASSLPAWTKLHNDSQGKDLVAAYYQSKLYTCTLDTSTQTSTLYSVNTSTYALTEIGNLAYFAVDMAPAPTAYISRYGLMIQPYGPYLLIGTTLDPSGGVYGNVDLSEYLGENIYVAGLAAKSLDSTSAEYYVLDENGVIWSISLSGTTFGTPTKVLETGISTSMQYQSLYYDGTYLYWSHFADNQTVLLVINPTSGKVYNAGNFGDGVWPVGGLYVNNKVAPAGAADTMDVEEPVFQNIDLHSAAIENRLKEEAARMGTAQSAGSVNSLKDYTSANTQNNLKGTAEITKSGASGDETENTVTVSLYEDEGTTTNALYEAAYDSAIMSYVGSVSNADYSAVYPKDGKVYVAFADAEGIAAKDTIAQLSFSQPGTITKVTVSTLEKNEDLAVEDESTEITVGALDHIYIDSASLSLKEKIEANFYIYIPSDELGKTNINVTFDGETVTKAAEDYAPKTRNGRACRFVAVPTFARQMRDEITITVTDKETGAKKYLEYKGEDKTNGFVFKVEDYVKLVEENSDDELLLDLVHKMDNYGKYAQIQFAYRTDTFDGAEEIKDFDDNLLKQYAMSNEGTAEGISYTSGSLELQSDTGIRLYYTLEKGHSISEYTFTLDGEEVTPVLKSGRRYYVAIKGIAARQMNEWHTVTVTDAADNTITTKYSGLSYPAAVVASDAASDTLKNLARSIYLYWEAAHNYFN